LFITALAYSERNAFTLCRVRDYNSVPVSTINDYRKSGGKSPYVLTSAHDGSEWYRNPEHHDLNNDDDNDNKVVPVLF
jgi:hypothetical protein